MGDITIVGLGPGDFGFITMQAYEIIKSAKPLLLRTAKHPTVSALMQRGIEFKSYDDVYEKMTSFEKVYAQIAEDCVMQAIKGHKVVYAVPGSPTVAEKSVLLIKELAEKQGLNCKVIPGMSFLEILYTRLSIDPIEGITVVDALDLDKFNLNTDTAHIVTQVYNQQIASDVKLRLMDYYPDEFMVTVVQNLACLDENIYTIPLYELDRQHSIDHLTTVYVPALPAKSERFELSPIISTMAQLRSPGGCVWDLEQTHDSLRRYMIEEVYEVIEAIELEDEDRLCEELGDLLLQVVFHARVAEEAGTFTMQDVIDGVTQKLIRRHPHVFGDITVKDAAEVMVNWEKIKKSEKGHERKNVLDGIFTGMPSLMRAYKLQQRAAKVGFDWEDIQPVWQKLNEEINELKDAVKDTRNKKDVEVELGDVLFTIVNLARFLKVEPEVALTATNNKFIKRFRHIEDEINVKGLDWKSMNLENLDKLWEAAKRKEKNI